MKKITFLVFYASILLAVMGCGSKMLIPPEVDLGKYESVGIIEFTTKAEGNIGKYITQRFIEEISNAQKGVRIVELGEMNEVMRTVNKDAINPITVRAIGEKYRVKALILGELEISKVKPKVSISTIVTSMSAKAEVEASLTAKLLETKDGATIWTSSARDKVNVAQVSIFPGGNASFDASNPKDAYGNLADELVKEISTDFKATRRRHKGRY